MRSGGVFVFGNEMNTGNAFALPVRDKNKEASPSDYAPPAKIARFPCNISIAILL